MAFVYIVAPAPWGPVQIKTAATSGELLRQFTAQPAHIEDVGSLDAVEIAEAARSTLAAKADGAWFLATVARTQKAVQDARKGHVG